MTKAQKYSKLSSWKTQHRISQFHFLPVGHFIHVCHKISVSTEIPLHFCRTVFISFPTCTQESVKAQHK